MGEESTIGLTGENVQQPSVFPMWEKYGQACCIFVGFHLCAGYKWLLKFNLIKLQKT